MVEGTQPVMAAADGEDLIRMDIHSLRGDIQQLTAAVLRTQPPSIVAVNETPRSEAYSAAAHADTDALVKKIRRAIDGVPFARANAALDIVQREARGY